MTTLDSASATAAKAGDSVSVYDFQQAGKLNEAHVQALSALHEGLMRSLNHALGSSLGTTVDVKLSGMEELPICNLAPNWHRTRTLAGLTSSSSKVLAACRWICPWYSPHWI